MDSLEEKFIGVCSLNAWTVIKPDGSKTHPFSGNVEGLLIYHPSRWMSATIMQKNRKNVSDNRSDISKINHKLNNKTEIELDSNLLEIIKDFFLASNGYVSYAGEFNVDNINVYHNLKISLLPQWAGTILTRKYKFSSQNNILNLTAELNGFKDSLKWEKI